MKDQRDTCLTKPTRDMGQGNNSLGVSQNSIIIFFMLEGSLITGEKVYYQFTIFLIFLL